MSVEQHSTIDEERYRELASFAASRKLDRGPDDPMLADVAERVLCHEARLLDDQQYRQWLARFAADALYWVPIDPDSDPRTKVSFMLDDRRRLEDRIALLETGWTHSQQPVSRVCRQVSNVAAWPLEPNTTEVAVRCSVVAWEYRRNSVTPFVSRNDYILRDLEGDWTIARKIVSLVNSRGDVRKFPFIL